MSESVEAAAVPAAPGSDKPPRGGRLFRKYFIFIIALVCGALLLSSAIGLYFSYQENTAALASLQHEKAIAAAARIDQFVQPIEGQLRFSALLQLGSNAREQRRLEFLKMLRLVPAITDVSFIDSSGVEEVSVSRLAMDSVGGGRDRSQEPAFRNARPGETWFGPVYFRKETEPYMTIAVRGRTESSPVAVAEVNLKFVWDVISRIRVGQKGKAYAVDATGHLVADPDIGLVLRKTDLSALPHVKAALSGTAGEEPAMASRDPAGVPILVAFAPIERLRWQIFAEQPSSEVYATLNASIIRALIVLALGLVLSALAALFLARNMVRPIRTLQEGAQRIGAGELDQRIEVNTGDELETLAREFNRMSAKLRESYADLERKIEARTHELRETLDQQTATAEVLRVTSSSPTDVQPVLDAVAERAVQLCEGAAAVVYLREGGGFMRRAAAQGAFALEADESPIRPLNPLSLVDRAVCELQTMHVEDISRERHLYPLSWDAVRRLAREKGLPESHTMVAVPMIRKGAAVGALMVRRTEVRPFTEKQVALLQTFADQAVIAIENVRLFHETREALEQQTATSEVLRVMSRSLGDIQPVFDAIVASCIALMPGSHVTLRLIRDGVLRRCAWAGPLPDVSDYPADLPLDHSSGIGTAVLDAKLVHVPDLRQVIKEYPRAHIGLARGLRSALIVPLIAEGTCIGGLSVNHAREGPFSEKEIAAMRIFADQAVIAIENVRLFNEIREKSRQLEIANKHKSEFLANMSHELRTPLNAIIGFSEVLNDRMFGDLNDDQGEFVRDIHESGKHLLSLINDILDLSKVEAGRMELVPGEFEIGAAIDNAITLVKERASRHRIGLSYEIGPELRIVVADERKLKQILLNLLSNAVKFTPEGGKVRVTARRLGDGFEIAVSDTGVGIAPEDQEAVFEEFRQVGRDYIRKAEGTGLGLALARKFVELHGGRIRLESEVGKGSTFTFHVPALPAVEAIDHAQ